MNKFIKLRRIGLGLILALLVAAVIVVVGLAADFYEYSESSLYYINGPDTPISTYNTGCRGSYCRYLFQQDTVKTGRDSSAWRWAWSNDSIRYWYAYCPTIGQAAARYGVYENRGAQWSIVMNQANPNNQGRFVYLGSSSAPYEGGYLKLHNGCVDGFWCPGLKVYWDNVIYHK